MSVTIACVEAFPINYPVAGRFEFFEGPKGRPDGRPAVVVKITADNGAVGWGQSVPSQRWSYEMLESVYSTIKNYLAPELVGRDPFAFDSLHALMGQPIAPSFSTGQLNCKAGIDLALHKLTGKLLNCTPAQRGVPCRSSRLRASSRRWTWRSSSSSTCSTTTCSTPPHSTG